MILLSTLDWIDGGDAKSMVSLPRFHHQYHPDYILYEKGALTQNEISKLESMGHRLKQSKRKYGNMQIIEWNQKNKKLHTASDPRGNEKNLTNIY